jgi:hypothetical protein
MKHLSTADELKESYELLRAHAKMSSEVFSDQFARFGLAGIRQLVRIVALDLTDPESMVE